ncbi:hypothetical protein HBI52_224830 [Parastagonospora nodorum]|nr:hypothetical protein HBH52_021830 [Parastagonospora nodorum]KAH4043051.1 hypothetical protein HBH49_238440 [Parastagonospora nodorum]KAH5169427.1 hypothetical protein HBH68_219760 [Parastagonospora nodorum]KAH5490287.1 hypothetical protein HBI52_224830 [Parastagonospora nodorum]KAH5999083.1 hypothetical protein HBI83_224400 [Parastagonospora nodorum]
MSPATPAPPYRPFSFQSASEAQSRRSASRLFRGNHNTSKQVHKILATMKHVRFTAMPSVMCLIHRRDILLSME